MDRPKLKVADVLRRYGEAYLEQRAASLSTTQRRVMSAIEPSNWAGLPLSAVTMNIAINAPTNALGLGEDDVEVLGIEVFSLTILDPLSGRDCRHRIPKQRTGVRRSVPGHFGNLTHHCRRSQTSGRRDRLLRRTAQWETKPVFSSPISIVLFLAAGSPPDDDRWVSCRSGFFLPARVLSRLFRRLQKAFDDQQLHFFSSLHQLQDSAAFSAYHAPLRQAEWVVYGARSFISAASLPNEPMSTSASGCGSSVKYTV